MSNSIPTANDFMAAYPAYQNMDPATVQLQLDLAVSMLSQGAFGDHYSQAVNLDVAHNLALMSIASAPGGQGAFQAAIGPVTSSSAAGMSMSFNTAQFDSKSYREQWYSKTVYGQQLLRLWNMCVDSCVLSA